MPQSLANILTHLIFSTNDQVPLNDNHWQEELHGNIGGITGDIVVFGRKQPNQSNPIRGIDFDFGKEPADTFTRDQHPDLRADFVMALPSAAARSLPRSHPADPSNGRINPPFNIKEWWDGKLEGNTNLIRGASFCHAAVAKFIRPRL